MSDISNNVARNTNSSESSNGKKYIQVGLLSAAHFLNDFYCNFLPILLPILIPKLGLSLTLSGVLVMVMSFSANVLQPVFGYFMDKYNFTSWVPYLIPFGAIFICITSWTSNFWVLTLLVALSGLAVSTFHPMGAGLVSKVAPENKVSSSVSYFVSGGNLGFALAPILLVLFMNTYSLDLLPMLIIPALILGILIYLSGLHKVRFVNESVAKNMHFDFRQILRNKPLMMLNISMGIRAWIFTAIVTFLPLWAIQKGMDNTVGGSLLTLYLCGSTTGSFLAGFLNEHFGYKKIILAALFFAIFPTAYFLISEEFDLFVCIALFLAGAMAMAPNPGAIVWGQKFLPDNPGMASGMMLGLSFGLGGIGTMLTSALAEHVGLTLALGLTTTLLVIGVILAYFTPETLPEDYKK